MSAPAAPEVAQASTVLQPSPASASAARRLVRATCEQVGVDEGSCDTAVLLTSEVVTNAFTHGRSEARLHVQVGARLVRVEVGDDNSRHPHLQAEDPDALDGRGLRILAVAASRWGVRAEALGKTVWFEVDRAAGP